ncbi:flavodoxin [uncultured Succinivibrio sp.]|uniref:flavodoxin n=1 Tax=uncultured Succinivibrio sp. TaxID=540749 RepID=UPI0025E59F99|nr:flavodoxin [uncultured Succinivibrio sp.]
MFEGKLIKLLIAILFAVVSLSTISAHSEAANVTSAVVVFSPNSHTKEVGKMIANSKEAPLFEIVPQQPYSADDLNYRLENCRATLESTDPKSRPEIANDLKIVQKYDVIYLGAPVWFRKPPKIILTFLDKYNLKGKKIYVFVTSGGSPVYNFIEELRTLYPSLNFVEGRRFRPDEIQSNVDKWLDSLN